MGRGISEDAEYHVMVDAHEHGRHRDRDRTCIYSPINDNFKSSFTACLTVLRDRGVWRPSFYLNPPNLPYFDHIPPYILEKLQQDGHIF
jgi:hypothetical protein